MVWQDSSATLCGPNNGLQYGAHSSPDSQNCLQCRQQNPANLSLKVVRDPEGIMHAGMRSGVKRISCMQDSVNLALLPFGLTSSSSAIVLV